MNCATWPCGPRRAGSGPTGTVDVDDSADVEHAPRRSATAPRPMMRRVIDITELRRQGRVGTTIVVMSTVGGMFVAGCAGAVAASGIPSSSGGAGVGALS